jgi:hypothetical protein
MSTRTAEIVSAIRIAQGEAAAGRGRPGIRGTAWSFTDCVISPGTSLLFNTDGLNAERTEVLNEAVLSTSVRRHLVHVEAGMKLNRLNCLLDSKGLAMPTLGGSRGQSVAGVMSTGVHGSDIALPPVVDCVRAIHLIGAGGQEWWIEPSSSRLTDPLSMARLRDEGVFCRNIRIEYNDDLFNAVLVSMGCAGVIYAVVLEARDAFRLHTVRAQSTWDEAQALIQRIASGRGGADYIDININPATRSCRVTRRVETDAPLRGSTAPQGTLADAARIAHLVGPGALVELSAEVTRLIAQLIPIVAKILSLEPLAIATASIEFAALGISATNPEDALNHLTRYFELLSTLALGDVDFDSKEDLARILPLAINYVWTLGMIARSGRSVVDALQDALVLVFSPDTDDIEDSYVARTGQPTCLPDSPGKQDHNALDKLVTSFEFAVPTESAISFANEVMNIVSDMRGGHDAVVVNMNLRFTRATQALLGMQQFERTCHFEIYTFKGMAGNDAFHERLENMARRFEPGAVPHWGQLHSPDYDFRKLFGRKLDVWRWAMNHIASNGSDTFGLFWNDFARNRGLLSRPTAAEPAGVSRLNPILTGSGVIELYCVGMGSLWLLQQRAPDDYFSEWRRVFNSIHSFSLTTKRDGVTEIYAIDAEARLMRAPRPPASGTAVVALDRLLTNVREVAVSKNADGRLELLAVDNRGRLMRTSQLTPGGRWRAWTNLGLSVTKPVFGQNLDGRLEAFAIASDSQVLSSYQLTPGGEWTSWVSVGGSARDIAVARNQDGRLELFVISPTSTLEKRYQARPNSGWVDWHSLGGSIRQLEVASNLDGRLEVFAISTDNSLDHIYQASPNGGWSSWQRFEGSRGAREVAVCRNAEGKLEVYIVRSPEGSVHRIVQVAPSSWWGNFHGLGLPM